MQEELDLIREQATKIERSGALGRSRSYGRLLEFLVECSTNGRTPKELEIAMEVFGRGADFDPSQDSMVRVYAHNLRQKLEHYYATDGAVETRQLTLARGEYRMSLATADRRPSGGASPPPRRRHRCRRRSESPPPRTRGRLALAAVVLLAFGVALGVGDHAARAPAPTAAATVAESPMWATCSTTTCRCSLVVGDYYIFGELDEQGDVTAWCAISAWARARSSTS